MAAAGLRRVSHPLPSAPVCAWPPCCHRTALERWGTCLVCRAPERCRPCRGPPPPPHPTPPPQLSGLPLAQYFQERIFEPARLDATFFDPSMGAAGFHPNTVRPPMLCMRRSPSVLLPACLPACTAAAQPRQVRPTAPPSCLLTLPGWGAGVERGLHHADQCDGCAAVAAGRVPIWYGPCVTPPLLSAAQRTALGVLATVHPLGGTQLPRSPSFPLFLRGLLRAEHQPQDACGAHACRAGGGPQRAFLLGYTEPHRQRRWAGRLGWAGSRSTAAGRRSGGMAAAGYCLALQPTLSCRGPWIAALQAAPCPTHWTRCAGTSPSSRNPTKSDCRKVGGHVPGVQGRCFPARAEAQPVRIRAAAAPPRSPARWPLGNACRRRAAALPCTPSACSVLGGLQGSEGAHRGPHLVQPRGAEQPEPDGRWGGLLPHRRHPQLPHPGGAAPAGRRQRGRWAHAARAGTTGRLRGQLRQLARHPARGQAPAWLASRAGCASSHPPHRAAACALIGNTIADVEFGSDQARAALEEQCKQQPGLEELLAAMAERRPAPVAEMSAAEQQATLLPHLCQVGNGAGHGRMHPVPLGHPST